MGGSCGRIKESTRPFCIGKSKDFESNVFKEVEIFPEQIILIARVERKLRCIGSMCPHCGAYLGDGIYFAGRIRCPIYGSCYDFITGDLEDFPGIDGVPTFKIKETGKKVFVYANPRAMPDRFMRPLSRRSSKSNVETVIIGSGAAGFTCAQTLRQEGYEGRLVMVTKEAYLPYDRCKLNKTTELYLDELLLRDESFYKEYDIEVILETEVKGVDLRSRKLYFNEHDRTKPALTYNNLVIATGLFNLHFDPAKTPGCNLKNIQHIYKIQDASRLYARAKDSIVVIAGSSFVAIEIAQTLVSIAKSIVIISRNKSPYGIVFGESVGEALLNHLKRNGSSKIHFVPLDECRKFAGNANGEVIGVVTAKKKRIKCDFVLIAHGGLPNTALFGNQGLSMRFEDGAIVVNKYMETNIDGVYGAGDCCAFPFHLTSDDKACVPHWQAACITGKVAALNILCKGISSMDTVPLYTTDIFDVPVHYVGYGEHYDDVDIFGDLENLEFCAVYYRLRKLTAACVVGCDTLGVELAMILEDHKSWTSDELPSAIVSRFPDPPIKGEILHRYITHHEVHTREWYEKQDIIGATGKSKIKYENWKSKERKVMKPELQVLSPFLPPDLSKIKPSGMVGKANKKVSI